MDAAEIRLLKEELRKDLEAIERVERLMAAKNSPRPADEHQLPPGAEPAVAGQEPDDSEDFTEAPRDSLRGTIERIVNTDTTTRWTTQKVLARLKELNFNLRAKKPIYSVGQSLNILATRGRIRVARRGAGSAPNIYKGIERTPAAAGQGGDATATLTQ
jgi:hypothetical protein